jgi:hypothetical protein
MSLAIWIRVMERALNVYTGQNPRQHAVLMEIQPNAYNKYLPQTAGVNLHLLG